MARQTRQRFSAITIYGDRTLVDEYAALCAAKGYRVTTHSNPGKGDDVRGKATPARLPGKTSSLVLELTLANSQRKLRTLSALDRALPKAVPILSACTTLAVADQAANVTRPERLVGIGAFPTLLHGQIIELADSPTTGEDAREAADAFVRSLGREACFIPDTVGLVMPRILCSIINEACFATTEGVARATDIDTAMKLGTNYPHGPLEWAERIGPVHVHAVMKALHAQFGEDRYRPAPLLRRAALLGRFPS